MSYIQNVQNKIAMEKALRYEETHPTINRRKFNTKSLQLFLVGDEHIGNAQHDREKLMKNLDWAYKNNIYLLHMGDGIETATKNSVGAGVYEQTEIVDQQMSEWIAIYEPFVKKGLFLGAHVGNHELRAYKDEGVNLMRHMCREIGAKYLGIGKASLLRVGNQTYTLYTTHGSSGARLPYTKIKAALDLEKIIDVEIYAIGHVHQLSHHIREFYSVDKKNKIIKRSNKHFILTGSYLDYWNSYAHVSCMEPSRTGSPLLTLNGEKHQINVSLQ